MHRQRNVRSRPYAMQRPMQTAADRMEFKQRGRRMAVTKVPLHPLQRQCTRAVAAWVWCKRSRHDRPRLAAATATYRADPKALALPALRSALANSAKSGDQRGSSHQSSGSRKAAVLVTVRSTGRARQAVAWSFRQPV